LAAHADWSIRLTGFYSHRATAHTPHHTTPHHTTPVFLAWTRQHARAMPAAVSSRRTLRVAASSAKRGERTSGGRRRWAARWQADHHTATAAGASGCRRSSAIPGLAHRIEPHLLRRGCGDGIPPRVVSRALSHPESPPRPRSDIRTTAPAGWPRTARRITDPAAARLFRPPPLDRFFRIRPLPAACPARSHAQSRPHSSIPPSVRLSATSSAPAGGGWQAGLL